VRDLVVIEANLKSEININSDSARKRFGRACG